MSMWSDFLRWLFGGGHSGPGEGGGTHPTPTPKPRLAMVGNVLYYGARPIALAGYCAYDLVSNPRRWQGGTGTIDRTIDTLSNYVNYARVFHLFRHSDYCTVPYQTERTAHLSRLRHVCRRMEDAGIVVGLNIVDWWSIRSCWHLHPWRYRLDTADGREAAYRLLVERGDLLDALVLPLVQECAEQVGDLGNVLWVPGNEPLSSWVSADQDAEERGVYRWHQSTVEMIRTAVPAAVIGISGLAVEHHRAYELGDVQEVHGLASKCRGWREAEYIRAAVTAMEARHPRQVHIVSADGCPVDRDNPVLVEPAARLIFSLLAAGRIGYEQKGHIGEDGALSLPVLEAIRRAKG